MPATTPNFNIPYPCSGDTIDCSIFESWAAGIDNALATVRTASELASQRPRAMLRTADTGVAVAVGGAFVGMTYNRADNPIYNGGLTLTGVAPNYTGFSITLPQIPGWYLFMAQFTPLNAVTTVTSFEGRITVDGLVFGRTLGDSLPGTVARPITVMGMALLPAALPGAQASYAWTGSGGPMNIYSQFSCQFMAPA